MEHSVEVVVGGVIATGSRWVEGLSFASEAGGELGFPSELGGVAEEPVPAPRDGGFDIGDALDAPLGLVETATASLELGVGAASFRLEAIEVALLGADPMVNVVETALIGATEPPPLGHRFELCLIFGQAAANRGVDGAFPGPRSGRAPPAASLWRSVRPTSGASLR